MSAPARENTWAWLGRVENRNPDAEKAEFEAAVKAADERSQPYADLFPALRGRAWSDRHGLSVDVDARGRVLAARVANDSGLGALFAATANRVLDEAARQQGVADVIASGSRAAHILPPDDPPKGYRRGAWEREQWSEVVEWTELAVLGDELAKKKLAQLMEEPVIAVLRGEDAAFGEACMVTARCQAPLTVRFPHIGPESVATGWRVMAVWRAAWEGLVADYAEHYEEARARAVREHYAERHPGTPGHLIPAVVSELADVRRYTLPPSAADPEAEALLDEQEREAFAETVRFEVVV